MVQIFKAGAEKSGQDIPRKKQGKNDEEKQEDAEEKSDDDNINDDGQMTAAQRYMSRLAANSNTPKRRLSVYTGDEASDRALEALQDELYEGIHKEKQVSFLKALTRKDRWERYRHLASTIIINTILSRV
jgi:hypothetical protein